MIAETQAYLDRMKVKENNAQYQAENCALESEMEG
jgi:hypothetical protein